MIFEFKLQAQIASGKAHTDHKPRPMTHFHRETVPLVEALNLDPVQAITRLTDSLQANQCDACSRGMFIKLSSTVTW